MVKNKDIAVFCGEFENKRKEKMTKKMTGI
jgi:hypothetical protein